MEMITVRQFVLLGTAQNLWETRAGFTNRGAYVTLGVFPPACYHKKDRGVNKVYYNQHKSTISCSGIRRCICVEGDLIVIRKYQSVAIPWTVA